MKRSSHGLAIALAATGCLIGAQTALAHPGHLAPGTSAAVAGALHPLTGADHLLAMLASGLLAVRIGTRRALWLVPATFVSLMLLGGVLAYAGLSLPHPEWGISLSVIVLGMAVSMLPSVPLELGAGLVGLFALFHGHAHVAELGGQALLPYVIGFTLATLALHAVAIGGGVMAVRTRRPDLVRWAGAAVAAGFGFLLIGL